MKTLWKGDGGDDLGEGPVEVLAEGLDEEGKAHHPGAAADELAQEDDADDDPAVVERRGPVAQDPSPIRGTAVLAFEGLHRSGYLPRLEATGLR